MAKKSKSKKSPTQAQVEKFEMLEELANSMYMEIKAFSSKKPDDLLNKFKVKNINRVLSQLKEVLSNEPTSEFLDLLDEESLPTNSDVIIILGQFKAAMKQFRSDHKSYSYEDHENVWITS